MIVGLSYSLFIFSFFSAFLFSLFFVINIRYFYGINKKLNISKIKFALMLWDTMSQTTLAETLKVILMS